MAKRAPSRRIEDPVVAAPPAGVRLRTRIQVTDVEAAALTVIAITLGELYRAELANRVRLGRLEREAQWAWRAEHKHAITAVSSSRWAGAITRAVEDQYQLGMRGLAAHVASLRRAIGALEARCALRPGAVAEGAPSAVGVGPVGATGPRRNASPRLAAWHCYAPDSPPRSGR